MKNTIIGVVAALLVIAGLWYAFSGGEKSASGTFGLGASGTVVPIADILADPASWMDKTVTVEGVMTKECSGSGCWWYVKDSGGEIRADSFGGGFALPLHQEGRRIRTTGKVVEGEGGGVQIAATGAEFK